MLRSKRAWLLCLLLACCAHGPAAKNQVEQLDELIAKARAEHAEVCSPKALALAEANQEFARVELQQGNFLRAEEHLALAEPNAKKALKDSIGCETREIAIQGPTDKDKDRIPDLSDACPEDPEDYDDFEDVEGCPELDNDKDTIVDTADKCALIPEDLDKFEDEDGCPEDDNDKDGIVDKTDGCPLDPEDKDSFQDEDGCPELDNDQDKIADKDDKCINEPETYNGVDDTDGCPDYKLITIVEDKIVLSQKIFFAKGKTVVLPKSFPLLNEVAQALKDKAKITVRIEGHTSNEGSDASNLKLSQGRANAVRQYLIDQGIDSARMESQGYGESLPLESNAKEPGREKNRRVEFFITTQ
jgi:outer membrane protein OmpA-like peptidoglycan-associated protein